MISLLAETTTQPSSSPAAILVPLLLMGGLFYFLLIRPQQRRARQQRQLTQELGVGDEVLTAGGIFGVVRDLDDESITVEISPGTNVRMLKQAIARRLTDEYEEPEGEPDTSP